MKPPLFREVEDVLCLKDVLCQKKWKEDVMGGDTAKGGEIHPSHGARGLK